MVRNEASAPHRTHPRPKEDGRRPLASLGFCTCLVSQHSHCKGSLFRILKRKKSVLSSTFGSRKCNFNQAKNKCVGLIYRGLLTVVMRRPHFHTGLNEIDQRVKKKKIRIIWNLTIFFKAFFRSYSYLFGFLVVPVSPN